MMLKTRNKLVCGVGINDAAYNVCVRLVPEDGKQSKWTCPYYSIWVHMLQRCYDPKIRKLQPSYTGCFVCNEWHLFSKFRSWMEQQDWQGNQLDKDLLVVGNKAYSPETCVFVSCKVNTFIVDCRAARGELPIGVNFHKATGKFQACCRSIETGKKEYLGVYLTPEEAHIRWLSFKLEQAEILAAEQQDSRVAEALIKRYTYYETDRPQKSLELSVHATS